MLKKSSIFGGIDSKIFDNRKFIMTSPEVHKLCKDFRLGSLSSFFLEKNVLISHSNFLVFLKTNKGDYVFKFYPLRLSKDIIKELVLNKYLIKRGIRTPLMITTSNNKPFAETKTYLISCYEYIQGDPLYSWELNRFLISKIVRNIYSLNDMLSTLSKIPRIQYVLDKESYVDKIRFLKTMIKRCPDLKEKELIVNCQKKIQHHYVRHLKLFIKRPIHSNISLSNILYDKNHIYILDLSHIRFDYELNDLANLYVSLCFFEVQESKMRILINEYFKIFKFRPIQLQILYNFIILHFLKEYLKILKKEENIPEGNTQPEMEIFRAELMKQKNKINKQIEKIIYQF